MVKQFEAIPEFVSDEIADRMVKGIEKGTVNCINDDTIARALHLEKIRLGVPVTPVEDDSSSAGA